MRILSISCVSVGLLLSASCGGAAATAGPATRSANAPTQEEVSLLPIGGCDETPVNEQVKRIKPRSLPWSYLITADATVACEEHRVLVDLGGGASIVLVSIGDDARGTQAAAMMPELVRGVADDLRTIEANARLSAERRTTLGDARLPAACGTVNLTHEGTALVSQICAASKTVGNASHIVLVAVTDTEQGFAQVGVSVDELLGGMVDGLVLE